MPYFPMPPGVAAEVQKAARERALAEIGQQAVDYAKDTGECLFCYRWAESVQLVHADDCPVGLCVAGAAAIPPLKST